MPLILLGLTTLLLEQMKIQLLRAYDVSDSYSNTGETLGVRIINTHSLHLDENANSLLTELATKTGR